MAFETLIIQAETATVTSPTGTTRPLTQTGINEGIVGNVGTKDAFNLRPGYSGSGYLDFGSATNGSESASFTFDSPVAGTFDLNIRYASSGPRTTRLSDGTSTQDVAFATTGTSTTAFDNWNVKTVSVTLVEGANTLRFALFGGNGPNIDALSITAVGAGADFPARFTTLPAYAVDEGRTAVGVVGAVDVDENTTDAATGVDPVTFSIAGGAEGSLFAIDAATGALSLVDPAVFAGAASLEVVVAATDSAGSVVTQTLAVSVNDVALPATGLTLDPVAVTENAAGAVVAAIIVADPDTTYAASDVTLQGADAGRFRVIDDGGLKLALAEGEVLDFEAAVQLSVTVTVAGFSQTFTPAPQNDPSDDVAGNEAPTAAAGTAATDEDSAVTIDLADLIADAEDIEPTVVSASVDVGTVAIDGTSLVFTPAANANGTATITYVVRDSDGAQATSTVTVAVAAVNDAPELAGTLAATNVAAGGGTISLAGLLASDVDGDTVTLDVRLQDGNAAPAGVTVDGGNLVIPGGLAAGSLSLAVFASDGSLESDPIAIAITIEEPAVAFETIVLQGEAFTLDIVGEQATSPNLVRTRTENPEKFGIFNPGGAAPTTAEAPDFDAYGLRKDYSGDGYLDINGNDLGAQASIIFDAPAGTYDVVVRYSNGSATQPRPISVAIDGTSASIADTRTGNFATWNTSVVTVTIASGGQHTLVFTQDSTSGAPNIDAVAIAAQGQGGTVVFDQSPEARPGATAATDEDTAISVDLAPFIADKEDGEPAITAATLADGTVTIDGTTLTFTPAADFAGATTIAYTVTDASGQSTSSTVR